jgi:hypothetical protein
MKSLVKSWDRLEFYARSSVASGVFERVSVRWVSWTEFALRALTRASQKSSTLIWLKQSDSSNFERRSECDSLELWIDKGRSSSLLGIS